MRAVVAFLVVVPALAGLALVGRHEGSTWRARENRGIAQVRRAVGQSLTAPEAFRKSPTFACLLYRHNGKDYGFELCFAPSGAIVEAIERSPGRNPKIWTVRSDPGGATVRENSRTIAHLLDRLGAQRGPRILVGGLDLGPEAPVHH
jgi:hypothetical protein